LSFLFNRCYSLEELNISNWNTPKNTNLTYTFCLLNLTSTLDVSNLDTSNVTLMDGCFSAFKGKVLDVSNWDVRKVTSMQRMFQGSEIEYLDLSNWQPDSCTTMWYAFAQCSSMNIDWFQFSNEYATINPTPNNLTQNSIDTLFENAYNFYNSNPPTRSLTISCGGGTSDAPSISGVSYIELLEDIFTNNNQNLTIVTNSEKVYTAIFNITDINSNIITGVTINIDELEIITEEENTYVNLSTGTYPYTLNKNGYIEYSDSITINANNLNVDIILEEI
jgi:surface protein